MSVNITQMITVYDNMFKLISENQKTISNLQLEILSRTQYTTLPQHFELFNNQITSNIEQMDCMLSQQTKIIDKMHELSSFLINNRRISSNVYIFGTTGEPSHTEQTTQHDVEPLIDISINILDNDSSSQPTTPSASFLPSLTSQQRGSLIEYTRFGLIENPLNLSCPITYETFQENSQVSRISTCGHIFNRNALTRWLSINQTCPTCRSTTSTTNTNTSSNRRRNNNGSRLRGNIENVLSEITENMLSRFLPVVDLSQNVFSREEML